RRAVDVADGERDVGGTIGGQVGLRSVPTRRSSDLGVVGAEDVDGDRGQRAVGAGHRERVAVGRAGGKLVVRRARRVGPGAGAVEDRNSTRLNSSHLVNSYRVACYNTDGERAGGGNI